MQRRNFLIAAATGTLAVPFAVRKAVVSAQIEDTNYLILEAISLECSRVSELMSEHGVWDELNRERGLSLAHNIRIASLIMVGYDDLLPSAVDRIPGGEGALLADVVVNGPRRLPDEERGFQMAAPTISPPLARQTFSRLQHSGVSGAFESAASGLFRFCDEDPELVAYCRGLENDRDEAVVASSIVCAAALADPTPILKAACGIAMAHVAALTFLYRVRCGHI